MSQISVHLELKCASSRSADTFFVRSNGSHVQFPYVSGKMAETERPLLAPEKRHLPSLVTALTSP